MTDVGSWWTWPLPTQVVYVSPLKALFPVKTSAGRTCIRVIMCFVKTKRNECSDCRVFRMGTIPGRRMAKLPLEGAIEGGFGFVPYLGGNPRDAVAAVR